MPVPTWLTRTQRFWSSPASNVVLFLAMLVALTISIVTYVNIPTPPPPLTLTEAQRRATDDLHQAVAEAFDGPWRHYTIENRPDESRGFCRKFDGFVTDQRIVTVTIALHGVDPERLDDYMLILSSWLPEYGWNISTRLYEPRNRYFVNATRDGYLITARTDENGVIVLSNSSPCAEVLR